MTSIQNRFQPTTKTEGSTERRATERRASLQHAAVSTLSFGMVIPQEAAWPCWNHWMDLFWWLFFSHFTIMFWKILKVIPMMMFLFLVAWNWDTSKSPTRGQTHLFGEAQTMICKVVGVTCVPCLALVVRSVNGIGIDLAIIHFQPCSVTSNNSPSAISNTVIILNARMFSSVFSQDPEIVDSGTLEITTVLVSICPEVLGSWLKPKTSSQYSDEHHSDWNSEKRRCRDSQADSKKTQEGRDGQRKVLTASSVLGKWCSKGSNMLPVHMSKNMRMTSRSFFMVSQVLAPISDAAEFGWKGTETSEFWG